jgi:hypothetical protein
MPVPTDTDRDKCFASLKIARVVPSTPDPY